MLKIQNVGAFPGGDAFLLDDGSGACLLDTGFGFCGEALAVHVRRALAERPLNAILLTHSHYDHACGAPHVQALYPDAPVLAHEYAAQVFQKPGAKRVMREMDQSAAALFGVTAYTDRIDALHADRILRDGDTVTVGAHAFTVLHQPGHTRCSIAFWCESERLLIASETLGVPAGGDLVAPAYLIGYGCTLDAIDRALALPVERMLLPHNGVLEGAARCRRFLENARFWAVEAHERVHAAHRAGADETACIELLYKLFYTPETAHGQPEKAFRLNASHMVPMLLRE